jgi:hypothetical protein
VGELAAVLKAAARCPPPDRWGSCGATSGRTGLAFVGHPEPGSWGHGVPVCHVVAQRERFSSVGGQPYASLLPEQPVQPAAGREMADLEGWLRVQMPALYGPHAGRS